MRKHVVVSFFLVTFFLCSCSSNWAWDDHASTMESERSAADSAVASSSQRTTGQTEMTASVPPSRTESALINPKRGTTAQAPKSQSTLPDKTVYPSPFTSAPRVPAPTYDNNPNSDAGDAGFAAQVIELCNKERAKAGLPSLKSDNQALFQAAGQRAGEIKSNFSHTRPNGTNYATILQEYGISNSASGENIAYGQRTPQEVVDGWMNSSGHRANILNGSFSHIGVGFSNYNWTQLFIRT